MFIFVCLLVSVLFREVYPPEKVKFNLAAQEEQGVPQALMNSTPREQKVQHGSECANWEALRAAPTPSFY